MCELSVAGADAPPRRAGMRIDRREPGDARAEEHAIEDSQNVRVGFDAEVAPRLKRAAARAQPVYALRQPNGSVNVYFGAYESPQEASLAVPAARRAGLAPTLVYRIGRVF